MHRWISDGEACARPWHWSIERRDNAGAIGITGERTA